MIARRTLFPGRYRVPAVPGAVFFMILLIGAGGLNGAAADFIGHGGMVRAAAISADGSKVLTGSFDYTAKLWDFAGQTELLSLEAHDGPVNGVAFLPGGAQALTVSDDRTAILWNLTTGKPERRFKGHQHKVVGVAVGPDGRIAATGGWDRTVRLWDLETGRQLRSLKHPSPVNAVAFADDGKKIISGAHDGIIRIWDARSGRALGRLEGHELGVSQLDVSGGRLLSAGLDKTMRLWDLGAGKQIAIFGNTDKAVLTVAFSSDGRTALSAGADGTVNQWDLRRNRLISTIRAHDNMIWAVRFSPDGRFAITASSDETARVWHLETGDRIGIPVENDTEPKPWLVSDHPGAGLYKKCAKCHSLRKNGRRRSGPHLAGLFGRRAGSVPGYRYSAALNNRDFEWNAKTLTTLFRDGPDQFLPGTKMPLQRVPDAVQLAHLVEYLRQLTATEPSGGPAPTR